MRLWDRVGFPSLSFVKKQGVAMRLEQTICLRISISKRETSAKPHKTNKNNEKLIRTNKKHKKHNVKTKKAKNNNIFGPWSLYLQPIVPKYCFFCFFLFLHCVFWFVIGPNWFLLVFYCFRDSGPVPKRSVQPRGQQRACAAQARWTRQRLGFSTSPYWHFQMRSQCKAAKNQYKQWKTNPNQ